MIDACAFLLPADLGRCTVGNHAWHVPLQHEYADDRTDEPVPDGWRYLFPQEILPGDGEPEFLLH